MQTERKVIVATKQFFIGNAVYFRSFFVSSLHSLGSVARTTPSSTVLPNGEWASESPLAERTPKESQAWGLPSHRPLKPVSLSTVSEKELSELCLKNSVDASPNKKPSRDFFCTNLILSRESFPRFTLKGVFAKIFADTLTHPKVSSEAKQARRRVKY